MPVYPTAGPNASCVSPNCPCHDRLPRYPSDLTDAQWAVLQPEARAAMADLVRCSGRPILRGPARDGRCHRVRDPLGIEWRALPADFPPHPAVYAFFERWSARGLPQRLVDVLRAGSASPTAAPHCQPRDRSTPRASRPPTPSATPHAATTAEIMPGVLLCRVGPWARPVSLVSGTELGALAGITTVPRGRQARRRLAGSGAGQRSGVRCGRAPVL